MRTAIATVCLSGTLEEKLEAAAAAGFDGIEIFELDLVVSPLSVPEIVARTQRLGLTIDLYQPFRDLEGVDEEMFQDNLRRLDEKLALMEQLGADTLLVCSNVATATTDDTATLVDQLRRAAELAARRGMRIAYEALAWGTHVNTYGRAWELVRRADHPALGVCLDSFHILARGDSPAAITDIPTEKIFFVQLADAPALDMGLLPWSRHHRLFPGEGDFDLTEFVAQLMRAGYDGPLSLEIFNDVFREADAVETAVDGMRSLIWLQQRVRGALGSGSAEAAALTAVPKIDPVERFDHVELRTDRPSDVGDVLTALGFVFVGQHRRSQAQLFENGDARVVISPAAAGGTRVASVAVRLPDAVAAAQRAQALGARRVSRPVPDGEAELPGVVSPGGWELVFVDDRSSGWMQEFGRSSSVSVPGDFRIDHVNTPEARTRFDAAALFLESMLRVEARSEADVASPRGLVRSKVFESPARGIRWVLNQVPSTLGALSSTGFSAHVAFATDDAQGVAARLLSSGITPLRPPENYYADLRARFGFDDQTLARWRDLGILVDRDGTGELLHFYTGDLGGLFLEVVERRGGYTGYGPGDAPVRIAAQAAVRR
ncbi:sugar phosphate isomerase/epimerase and 4-hydroxyphenylpyruvate domain-containing protein [Microbacterium sp. Marseille-Q6965]|uniref:sugar phosphate isomerase/epimerase and 4-hydroxyphenylpyruvate domain-containing protein n=1 Tax=Microbacterium sp. Marseille-Q6965 TaxID=2965072 RepID=UPI0021B7B282|nr:sugar phosphate isomerase/epimerase and 4-hydroxyphenylpyruvate domain-containing protein [Microbacterium sp. Marseille-Q6965]